MMNDGDVSAARAAFDAAHAHGWRGPVQIKEYAAECLIGAGAAPDAARRIVAETWIEQKRESNGKQ